MAEIMTKQSELSWKKAKEVGMVQFHQQVPVQENASDFFGMLNRQGVVPDPAKIDALKRLPEPKTEALLQSFLGIVNYLSWFDPKIADLMTQPTEMVIEERQMNSSWNGIPHQQRL